MGSACCVAARDKTIPAVSSSEYCNLNSRCSPTWSFRWENRGRVAGEDVSVGWLSDGINSHYSGTDLKREMAYASEDGSSLDGCRRRIWPNHPLSERTVGHVRSTSSDQSIPSGVSMDVTSEQVESRETSTYLCPSPAKLSECSFPSTSSPLTPLSKVHLEHGSSSPSKLSNHSQKLLQQVPGKTIPDSKLLASASAASERPAIPSWSNESYRGSFYGLSDGSSVNTSTELVETSCGVGYYFDSEAMRPSCDKMGKADSQISASTSAALRPCGVCMKALSERSSWSAQKIIANSELSVVAVLICGHVYHAECLEVMTSDIQKYDPACPVCTFGERQTSEMSEKALRVEPVKSNRRSRYQVVDSDVSGDLTALDCLRTGGIEGSNVKMDSGSETRISLVRPFLRRHFSLGSRGSRSLTEVHPNGKRGFLWTKSGKE